MSRRYWLQTLGCKLNQADTARLETELRSRGMVPAAAAEEADLLVVNTCTVTGRADADGRQILRRLARLNPGGRLVAMGCYANRDPEALQSLAGVDLVSGGSDPALVLREAVRSFPGELTAEAQPYHAVPTVAGRTRAYLKVQDGCNLTCSYCIIPTVRGRSRSLPAPELEASLRRLIEAGFVEVVLTGVNTGAWGNDLPGSPSLRDLLARLTAAPGLGRLRLNSLEPRTVTGELVDFLAATPRVARHLQIPLQSGSDRILARMRRNYRRRSYLDLLERLVSRLPDVGLGADVIVGFPGESEEDFLQTEELIRHSPLSYLHVFSYSARPGTDAAILPDAVPPVVIRDRARRLRDLAAEKGSAFRRRFIGRTLEAVTLDGASNDGSVRALTGNFFEVALPPGSAPGNALVDVEILEAGLERARGVPAIATASRAPDGRGQDPAARTPGPAGPTPGPPGRVPGPGASSTYGA